MRASTLAGVAILVIAGAALGVIALRDRIRLESLVLREAATETVPARASAPATSAMLLAQAMATSNVYAQPARGSEVIAVLPGGQRAAVMGRSADAAWLYVATPPTSAQRGWTPAAALRLDPATVAALPVVDARAVAASPRTPAPDDALPDPALSEVSQLASGQLVIGVTNRGPGALTDVTLMLSITRLARPAGGAGDRSAPASDEVIGILRIGPATLAAGDRASIVTPMTIPEPGPYRMELNLGREVPDADHSNNVIETTFPGRG